MKFKVGDKVKLLINRYSFGKVGDIITITEVHREYVTAIHPDRPDEVWYWYFEEIEKVEHLPAEVKSEELSTKKDIMLTDDASEHLSKRLIDDLNAQNDKLKKQIKLLSIMLQGRGYESLAIASALELLD